MPRAKGTHTCDIFQHYHRCPSCGKIVESRFDYESRLGVYHKDLTCSRCGKGWTEQKPGKPHFGPFFD